MEAAELADVYEKHAETRVLLSGLLFGAVQTRRPRMDSTEAFKPILPMLMAHFIDPDRNTRLGAVRVFWFLQPSPPLEALAPVISLSYTETDSEVEAMALQVLKRFCAQQSKQAVVALRDAAVDPDNRKKITALGVIGQSLVGEPPATCRDPELVEALSQGLKSGQPDVVRQAVHAAARFGPEAEPLRSELERVAADEQDAPTAAAARETLRQLQR
ncbi:MAG: HEAT repeat domain-containing protein [Verrucomicrobia bacterium]|nr:HEAT repeat domain-containing protein [Verrucomicrobiota bacterium]